ncbi:MAG: class I SAM-dependent methyltransferase [Candidatus Acidiferrum sp.]
MPANVAEWDARYREAAQNAASEPAGIVSEWLPMLPRGSALDIACGTGRHALLLAGRGEAVTAVDWSATGLEVLENRARNAKFPVRRADAAALAEGAKPRAGELLLVQASLEEIQLPIASFSVVLCVQYLQRSLFEQMTHALKPGGLLLFETFTRAQLDYSNGPRNPAYLLEPGELRTAFPELHVLLYRELNAGQGIASLVAQKPLRD